MGHFWKFNPDMGYFYGTYMEFVKSQVPSNFKTFMSGFGVLFNIVINKIIAYYFFVKYWKRVTIYVLLV